MGMDNIDASAVNNKLDFSRKNCFLLAAVTLSFAAFCIETDIYAPSFPNMVQFFDTTESRIQDILTWNFIGLCISGLFYGPLSDSFGRKRLLCFGLLLFAISSIACTTVTTIEQLIFWRFIQGLGCGAITGIGSTMVFDVYPSQQSAQLITILNSFITGMMAAAPMIGSWVNVQFGWQMNFVIVAIGAVLALGSTFFLVTETLPPSSRRPVNLIHILNDYRRLLTSFSFMGNTLIWTTFFGLLIVFTANLSLIFIDHLNVDPVYFGFYQASVMATFFAASLLAAGCIGKFGMSVSQKIGNGLFMAGIILLAIFVYAFPPSPIAFTVAMSMASAGSAIGCVVYYVESLSDFAEMKGAANALAQSLRLMIGAGMIALAANQFNGTMEPIALMGIATVALALLVMIGIAIRKTRRKNMCVA